MRSPSCSGRSATGRRSWARTIPDTLGACSDLAAALHQAGRLREAFPLYKRTLADRERLQGATHPDTMTARANLAYAYRSADKLKDALPLYARTLADRQAGPRP